MGNGDENGDEHAYGGRILGLIEIVLGVIGGLVDVKASWHIEGSAKRAKTKECANPDGFNFIQVELPRICCNGEQPRKKPRSQYLALVIDCHDANFQEVNDGGHRI